MQKSSSQNLRKKLRVTDQWIRILREREEKRSGKIPGKAEGDVGSMMEPTSPSALPGIFPLRFSSLSLKMVIDQAIAWDIFIQKD